MDFEEIKAAIDSLGQKTGEITKRSDALKHRERWKAINDSAHTFALKLLEAPTLKPEYIARVSYALAVAMRNERQSMEELDREEQA